MKKISLAGFGLACVILMGWYAGGQTLALLTTNSTPSAPKGVGIRTGTNIQASGSSTNSTESDKGAPKNDSGITVGGATNQGVSTEPPKTNALRRPSAPRFVRISN